MNNILVIGGSGFIGRNLSEFLNKININHTIFDRLFPKFECNFVLGDIRNIENISNIIDSYDGVINLAGILGTTETINTPEFCYSTNIIGALNLYECLKGKNIKCVQISVGNYWMNNPYSITKNTAEKLSFYYNKNFDTDIRIVRALNAYGPYQSHHPVRKLVPNLILPAINNEEILIFGDGEQKMDMIYVEDLAEMLFFVLQKDDINNETVYEAGMGLAPTVNQICKKVISLTSSKSKINHIEMRKGEDPNSTVIGDPRTMGNIGYNINKLTELDAGLIKTIKYYSK